MMDANGAIDWADVDAQEVLPGITRQRVDGMHATVIRYVYQPGSVFPVHQHPEEQTTVVLSGRIEFSLDGARAILGPGETALIAANMPHGARVLGDAAVETINVMAPVRRGEISVAMALPVKHHRTTIGGAG